MKSIKDLDAYKISKQVAVLVYAITKRWPKEKVYGLTSQIRRASVSVTSNLAEGYGRMTSKDTMHFLAIVRGSSFELEAQAEIGFDLGYISQQHLDEILALNERSRKMLNALINRYETL